MIDLANINVDGFVKIWDPITEEIFVEKHNAINPEVISYVFARMLQANTSQYITEMHFGNGGIVVDTTSNITYKDVELNLETGFGASLFNPTYFKVVDTADTENNDDITRNKVDLVHVNGLHYTDLVVTCTLDSDQPKAADIGNLVQQTQMSYDNGNLTGNFVFNELGLKLKGADGINTGYLMSHIVFHPVQKSANRTIQVVYTLRIRLA
jgi:hypothetical protein